MILVGVCGGKREKERNWKKTEMYKWVSVAQGVLVYGDPMEFSVTEGCKQLCEHRHFVQSCDGYNFNLPC